VGAAAYSDSREITDAQETQPAPDRQVSVAGGIIHLTAGTWQRAFNCGLLALSADPELVEGSLSRDGLLALSEVEGTISDCNDNANGRVPRFARSVDQLNR